MSKSVVPLVHAWTPAITSRTTRLHASFCAQSECVEEAARGEFCELHRKRRQRGKPLSADVRTRHPSFIARLTEAALALANVSTDDDVAWRRAQQRLLMVVYSYRIAKKQPNQYTQR